MMEPFNTAFENYRKRSQNLPAWVSAQSGASAALLVERGWPTRNDEEWKYTSLRNLLQGSYQWNIFGDAAPEALIERTKIEGATTLYIVNGTFAPGLSHAGAFGGECQDLAEALHHKDTVLRSFWQDFNSVEWQPFEALNQTFLLNGLYLRIPSKTKIPEKIHIVHIHTGHKEPIASFSQVLVDVESSAQVSIVESFVGEAGATYFVNPMTWIHARANSQVTYTRLQQESRAGHHIGTVKVRCERDAHVATANIALGGAIARTDYQCQLVGSGARLVLDGLFFAGEGQVIDNLTQVHHAVPHAESDQVYKGLIDKGGRGVFTGKIKVYKNAQQTSAFQVNKNLLLSPEAEIDTRPQLEIDADDVKCSHGAAIGRIDDDELFYLMSRGIPKRQAEHMLSKAFMNDVLLRIADTSIRDYVTAEAIAVLGENV